MNLESLRNKLIAAARANPPSDRVPYTFEQRIMARLRDQPRPDLGLLWTQMLWRAVAPCLGVSLMIGAWALFGGGGQSVVTETGELVEFSPDFEQTMLAGVDEQVEELW
jgi:hypothetical protein